ncbi:MAG: WbqC family protein [Candidatus Omnitrophica bacterium]|nr:WbqC family protein [Candidatus Omnitrophota bacterium]
MVIVSGHQPVYLPWLGLIHKASLCDVFVFMDDVQYLTQDWNNRNMIKSPQGKAIWLTVPVDLKHSASDRLQDILISGQEHVAEKSRWQAVHWASLRMAYTRAPFFGKYKPFFEWLYLGKQWKRLSDLNLAILKQVFEWFDLRPKLVIGSQEGFIGVKSDLVLEHGARYKADIVVTGIFGRDYIDTAKFERNNIKVVFQDYHHPRYSQQYGGFVPNLSFVDLLFNHGPESRHICLQGNVTREEICQGARSTHS